MTPKTSAKPGKLENDPIWKETSDLAEYMYSKLSDFPSEEEWNSKSKIRSAANDLLFSVAQAVGGETNPLGAEYDWSSVRKHLFSLKTMYRFACRQKFIELEPNIMVRLDALIDKAGLEIEAARKKVRDRDKAELKPWLEKYKLWKEMQK